MPNGRTKRKLKLREAEEREALEADGWVWIWGSRMSIDCEGMSIVFGPRGLEAVPPGDQPWEQKDVHQ